MSIVALLVLAVSVGGLNSYAARSGARLPNLLAVAAIIAVVALTFALPGNWWALATGALVVVSSLLFNGLSFADSPSLANYGYWGRVGHMALNGHKIRESDEARRSTRVE